MTEEEMAIIETMERYGGGFVSHLAKAWRRADPQNHARLLDAFPEYWNQYRQVMEIRAREKREQREVP